MLIPILHRNMDINTTGLPRYLAVEGPIAVGKTTLAKRLAEAFNVETLLDTSDPNPFLERFYLDRRQAALPTQLFFLFERARIIQELRPADMFQPVRIADFILEKDRLFAEINPAADELTLYYNSYAHLSLHAPPPHRVISLQAPAELLLQRVQHRGVKGEQNIEKDYLCQLIDAYTRFFHDYRASPLLIVNATEIDLAHGDEDFEDLVNFLLSVKSGRHYYNPAQTII